VQFRAARARAESVRNALRIVPADIEWVAVHDAARPLVSQELIDRTFAAAVEHGARPCPRCPSRSRSSRPQGPLPRGSSGPCPRDRLWAMQTPQVMRGTDAARRVRTLPDPARPGDRRRANCSNSAGHEVWLVAGEERNLKITTPMDLKLAELLLASQRTKAKAE
jgi:2-C-methyl-D-erythritol 4-phosphate cytidylyltransferase